MDDMIEVDAEEVIAALRRDLDEIRYQNLLFKIQVRKLRELLDTKKVDV